MIFVLQLYSFALGYDPKFEFYRLAYTSSAPKAADRVLSQV